MTFFHFMVIYDATDKRLIYVQVSGIMAPKPVSSFAHFGFDERLMKAIGKAGYTQPTPVQAQVYTRLQTAFSCALAAYGLHIGCILTTYLLHIHLHIGCILAVFWLHIG